MDLSIYYVAWRARMHIMFVRKTYYVMRCGMGRRAPIYHQQLHFFGIYFTGTRWRYRAGRRCKCSTLSSLLSRCQSDMDVLTIHPCCIRIPDGNRDEHVPIETDSSHPPTMNFATPLTIWRYPWRLPRPRSYIYIYFMHNKWNHIGASRNALPPHRTVCVKEYLLSWPLLDIRLMPQLYEELSHNEGFIHQTLHICYPIWTMRYI